MIWPSLLLAVIAACAAWVALQQMIIARKKLNHDLFDRRFAVFTATQDYFVACLNRNGGTHEDTSEFYSATRAAPFLFDKDLNEFLSQTLKAGIDIQVFGKHITRSDLPDHQQYLDTYHKAQSWLADEYESLTGRFEPTMNLANTKAFPIRSVVPFPDPRLLRDRILRSIHTPEQDKGHAE